MTSPPIDGIIDRDFTAATRLNSAGELVVSLSGTADVRVVEPLAAFVPKLHEYAQREKVTKVIVEFTGLDFMNSSCFKGLVSWIGAIQQATEKYSIEFRSSGAAWQRRSLQALTCFAPDLITVVGAERGATHA